MASIRVSYCVRVRPRIRVRPRVRVMPRVRVTGTSRATSRGASRPELLHSRSIEANMVVATKPCVQSQLYMTSG